jgi:hypothetical protein
MRWLVLPSADRATHGLLSGQQTTPHIAYGDQLKAVRRHAHPGQPVRIE